jgi:CHRD domain
MRKLLLPTLAVAALGVAACGSSSKSSSSSTSSGASTATSTTGAAMKKHHGAATSAKAPSKTYKLKLTGKAETPPGAPTGTGTAVVSLRGKSDQICWKFADLKGFTNPTFAHIHKGAAGTSGAVVVPLSTGTKFLASGCVHSTAAMLVAIGKDPHGYYVNVHSTKYPGGAVRSQL